MADEWTTLGDVVVESRGGTSIKTSEYTSSGTPVLTKGDVKPSGRVEHGGKFVSTEFAKANGWRFSEPGDLIVTTRDLTLAANFLGLVSRIPEHDSFVINQGATIFRIDESRIDPRYLVYWCCGSEYRQHIQDSYVGSTQIHIRNDDLFGAPLKLPPLSEQKAIAAVLGALDDKIELNRRMNATLEAMARALFQSWFVDFDPVRAKLDGRQPSGMDEATAALFPDGFQSSQSGPIPAGWGHTPLAEFCSKITDGAHQSPKSVDAGFPMASVKDMTDWEINVPGCRHISEVDYRSLVANGCQPELGDVLLAKDGATCLDTACEYQQKEQIVLLSSVAILRPKHSSDSAFLHTWLGLSSTKTYLKENFVSGSAIPRVVLRDMKRAQLICPPRSVLDAFARAAAPLREQIRHNHDQSRTLATLRDTLLPKLLSGEIGVNPTND
jgi:type I restriction enzyme S subunit